MVYSDELKQLVERVVGCDKQQSCQSVNYSYKLYFLSIRWVNPVCIHLSGGPEEPDIYDAHNQHCSKTILNTMYRRDIGINYPW